MAIIGATMQAIATQMSHYRQNTYTLDRSKSPIGDRDLQPHPARQDMLAE